jgi:hypothetical protein
MLTGMSASARHGHYGAKPKRKRISYSLLLLTRADFGSGGKGKTLLRAWLTDTCTAPEKGIKALQQVYRFTDVSTYQSLDSRPGEGFVLILLKEAEIHSRHFCSWKTHHLM